MRRLCEYPIPASLVALLWPPLQAPAPVEESHSLERKTATRRKHIASMGLPYDSYLFPSFDSSPSLALAYFCLQPI